ncbi:hypothetical protein [Neobacillus niacini]|uniref:hypothetical protein n=1 Tax=Neobacillus niacini TaxID=86668 RepID=UPI0028645604|nr:hypothetical protein [Neobacillus niacini]MDR6998700.1 hypothetical protein [Neobacillus niacini]
MIKKVTIFFLGLMLLIPLNGMAASNSKISIDMHYLVISPADDGSTNMMNMVNYLNKTARVYKGDGKSEGVLRVTLPAGANDLNFLDSKIAIKQTDTGFITKDPISANQTQVLPYSYRMPKGKEIKLSFDYPVQTMQVLVPEGMGSAEFKGVDATEQGLFKFENQNYWGYSVEGIKADQSFTVIYRKDKQPSSEGTATAAKNDAKTTSVTRTAPAFHNPGHIRMWEQSALKCFNPHVFLIVLLAMLIAGISYFAYFKRKARLEEEKLGADKEEKAFKLLMAKQKAIMDKILELEETFGDGSLSEDAYHAKLNAYKQHLVQVKLSLRKFVE